MRAELKQAALQTIGEIINEDMDEPWMVHEWTP